MDWELACIQSTVCNSVVDFERRACGDTNVLACLSTVTIGPLPYITPVRDILWFDWCCLGSTLERRLRYSLGHPALERWRPLDSATRTRSTLNLWLLPPVRLSSLAWNIVLRKSDISFLDTGVDRLT